MTVNTLFPSNNLHTQKRIAKYNLKSEFAEALHKLLYTIGLKIPKCVKQFLKWCSSMQENANPQWGIGAFFTSEKTIAEQMGVSERTVRRAIKWLKDHGLLFTYSSWNSKEDKKGTDYKAFACYNDVKAMIQYLINQQENEIVRKLSATMSATMSAMSEEQNPCESKDESLQNSDHIIPNIKTLDKNPLKEYKDNRLLETDLKINEPVKKPIKKPKKYVLKKEVKAILQTGILNALSEDQKQEFGNRIQILVKKMNWDVKDPDIQEALIEGITNFISQYEKNPQNIEKDYYGALYICMERAVFDYLIALEQIEMDEENEEDEPFYDLADDEHQGKHGYNGEFYHENKRYETYKTRTMARGVQKDNTEKRKDFNTWLQGIDPEEYAQTPF